MENEVVEVEISLTYLPGMYEVEDDHLRHVLQLAIALLAAGVDIDTLLERMHSPN